MHYRDPDKDRKVIYHDFSGMLRISIFLGITIPIGFFGTIPGLYV